MPRIPSQSTSLWSYAARNRIQTNPVPPVYWSVPSRAPGLRGKEEVERLLRLEAQYARVGLHLDVLI